MKLGNKITQLIIGCALVKYLVRIIKCDANCEVVTTFEKKYESRYKVRVKLNEILFTYLSEINLLLPLLRQKLLQRKMKKVLGFILLFQLFIH
jgi:hypothetical protein